MEEHHIWKAPRKPNAECDGVKCHAWDRLHYQDLLCGCEVSDEVANYRVSGGGDACLGLLLLAWKPQRIYARQLDLSRAARLVKESMEQVRKRAVECLEEAWRHQSIQSRFLSALRQACSSEDLVIAAARKGQFFSVRGCSIIAARDVAVGQNEWYHFGIGAPILVHFSGWIGIFTVRFGL